MKKGSILFHKKFEFKNGDVGEKLLVLLNTPKSPSEPYLFCKTTTRRKGKPKRPGCNPDLSLFFIPAGQDHFSEDTWLQLYDIYPFHTAPVLQDLMTKQAIETGRLKSETLRKVIACISKVKDVEANYRKYILGSLDLLSALPNGKKFRIKNKS